MYLYVHRDSAFGFIGEVWRVSIVAREKDTGGNRLASFHFCFSFPDLAYRE